MNSFSSGNSGQNLEKQQKKHSGSRYIKELLVFIHSSTNKYPHHQLPFFQFNQSINQSKPLSSYHYEVLLRSFSFGPNSPRLGSLLFSCGLPVPRREGILRRHPCRGRQSTCRLLLPGCRTKPNHPLPLWYPRPALYHYRSTYRSESQIRRRQPQLWGR